MKSQEEIKGYLQGLLKQKEEMEIDGMKYTASYNEITSNIRILQWVLEVNKKQIEPNDNNSFLDEAKSHYWLG